MTFLSWQLVCRIHPEANIDVTAERCAPVCLEAILEINPTPDASCCSPSITDVGDVLLTISVSACTLDLGAHHAFSFHHGRKSIQSHKYYILTIKKLYFLNCHQECVVLSIVSLHPQGKYLSYWSPFAYLLFLFTHKANIWVTDLHSLIVYIARQLSLKIWSLGNYN